MESTNDQAKNNLENLLKQNKVLINSKIIFTTYIVNHNIKYVKKPNAPILNISIWNEVKVKAKKVYQFI